MADDLKTTIEELAPELAETRHYLHQRPELSEKETQTAAFVADRLRALGLDVRTGVGGNGVVADLQASSSQAGSNRTFAIRADMDALPIQEENDCAYRSQNPGVMHACGHDGHTATLLGTAKLLTQHRDLLNGNVRFVFQPAEETVGGAKRMCAEGVMDGVDAIVALHGWPQKVALGEVGVRAGSSMASADTFDITIRGTQAHAAYPHVGVDPVAIAAQIVMALQTIASREIDPNDPVVVSVTKINAGTAYNIIPGAATLSGTYRTLSNEVRDSMPARIQRIAEGICAAGRATCECAFFEGTPAVINDANFVDLIEAVGQEMLGAEKIVRLPRPTMGAEDFAVYLDYAPGAMFFLGLGDVSPVHTPTFDFDDRALPIGVEMFSRIALKFLSGQ